MHITAALEQRERFAPRFEVPIVMTSKYEKTRRSRNASLEYFGLLPTRQPYCAVP